MTRSQGRAHRGGPTGSPPHARAALAALLVTAFAAAGTGCGSSTDRAAPSAATERATTSRPAAPSTTSPADRSTTTQQLGPTPIPTDPADLGSCDDVPSSMSAAMPSRRWPTVPAGWKVAYAYTTRGDPAASDRFGWSTLVRVDGSQRVTHLVTVNSGSIASSADPNTTVRGVPASIGPETTRGGPTGALQAAWTESDHVLTATSRGLDEGALRELLDRLTIDRDGAVTAVPGDWKLLGSGSTKGFPSATVLGLTGPDAPLLETGYAPVELQVDEPTSTGDDVAAIHLPGGLDVEHLDVRLQDVDGRPGLVTDLGDGQLLVHTTTAYGVTASASATSALDGTDLLALAASLAPISVDDPRLVGVPMGAVGSSTGTWCR